MIPSSPKAFGAKKDLNALEFYGLWEDSHGFASGCRHRYPPDLLANEDVIASVDNKVEAPLTPGKRLLPDATDTAHRQLGS